MKPQVWNFHGGIHPPEHKKESTGSAIRTLPLPNKLVLPLQQHLGQSAKPLVEVGERVLKGQQIAAAQGYISAALHAPTSGTVSAIEQLPLPHPSGFSGVCIVILPDGKEEWAQLTPIADYRAVDRATLLTRIAEAGIAGLGGAGFPTAVKLNPGEQTSIHTLVINAAECEPYITADDMLMRQRAEQVIAGIEILAHLLGSPRCLIGIEDNKPQAIAALAHRLELRGLEQPDQGARIELVVVPTKYPSGGEKQLIQLLTGKEVPSGAIPADIGVLCQNVGTLVAVYRAIAHGEPLISRITTVTGAALAQPSNFEALIGTPIGELLAYCGLDQARLHRLIMGGPMMGFTLQSLDIPIIKTTNCILAATAEELPDPAPEQPCIRCGMCAQVCPASLLPQQLYWFSRAREFDKALAHNLLDCIECGACSYVCPSNIPLVQYYRFAKGEIRQEELNHTKAEQSRQRFEARKARLAQQAADKEAKRKARLEETAEKKTPSAAAAGNLTADRIVADPVVVDQVTTDQAAADKSAANKEALIQAALERARAKKAAGAGAAVETKAETETVTAHAPAAADQPTDRES